MTTVAAPDPNAGGQQITDRQQNRQARRSARQQRRHDQQNQPPDPNAPPTLDQTNKDWAQAVLGGNFGPTGANVPMFADLTDPSKQDPTTNPYIQSLIGSLKTDVKSDWLGNLAASDAQAQASGSGLGSAYMYGKSRATQNADQALAQQEASIYTGAYENERNRRAGLFQNLLGAQQGASQIPIQYGQLANELKQIQAQRAVGMAGVSVQRGQLGLARQQFDFSRQMQTAQAQQSALNDYFSLLAGIGGMGGTQTGPGSYQPSTNPWAAALMGGAGGAAQGYGFYQQYGHH